MDLPDKDRGCHRTGFKINCRKLVTDGKCCRWMQITGSNPNTGEAVSRHDCIDDWIPYLLMENSKLQRETGAAVESFRNEMVKLNVAALNQAQNLGPRLTRHDPTYLTDQRDNATLDLFTNGETKQ